MISGKALALLKLLAEDGDDEYGYAKDELVRDGRKWMRGIKSVSGRTVNELIMWCCIRMEYESQNSELWTINETGRAMLNDPIGTCKHVADLLSGRKTE